MRITIEPETPTEAATQQPISINNVEAFLLGARQSAGIGNPNVNAFPIIAHVGHPVLLLHGITDLELNVMGILHAIGVNQAIESALDSREADAKLAAAIREKGNNKQILRT